MLRVPWLGQECRRTRKPVHQQQPKRRQPQMMYPPGPIDAECEQQEKVGERQQQQTFAARREKRQAQVDEPAENQRRQ